MPTDNRLLTKLYIAGKICGCTPFDPKITELTIPQLDFIIEMESVHFPGRFKFSRGDDAGVLDTEIKTAWSNTLTGKAQADAMLPVSLDPALLAILAATPTKR